MLLREFAEGKHADWLQSMVFLVAPIYNADGNERFALTNRGRQNGPIGGQGQRPNAQGLDLNRDYMKLESPEARAFVKLLNDYDPHVALRSAHDQRLAPRLLPDVLAAAQSGDRPAIIDLLRNDWLPSVTKTIKTKYGWDYYYYGNLEGRGGDRAGWKTFDSRPRFNNNYIGLRNRFAILSEAYAYATFEDRIKATNRFVEEVLNYAHAHAASIRKVTEAAPISRDRRFEPAASRGARAVGTGRRDPARGRRRGKEPERRPRDGPPGGRERTRADAGIRHVQGDGDAERVPSSITSRRT